MPGRDVLVARDRAGPPRLNHLTEIWRHITDMADGWQEKSQGKDES
jgi:hypothetical protein